MNTPRTPSTERTRIASYISQVIAGETADPLIVYSRRDNNLAYRLATEHGVSIKVMIGTMLRIDEYFEPDIYDLLRDQMYVNERTVVIETESEPEPNTRDVREWWDMWVGIGNRDGTFTTVKFLQPVNGLMVYVPEETK